MPIDSELKLHQKSKLEGGRVQCYGIMRSVFKLKSLHEKLELNSVCLQKFTTNAPVINDILIPIGRVSVCFSFLSDF